MTTQAADKLFETLPSELLSHSRIAVSYSIIPENLPRNGYSAKWVQAAAAAIGYALDMAEEKKFGDWQAHVSDTLDEIVSKLDSILQELKDLKVWFDDRISEETRRQYHQKITSIATDVSRIVTAVGKRPNNEPSQDQLTDLKTHFRDLRVTIDSLSMTDGYSHVMGVIAGIIVTIPLFTLLRRKPERADWAKRLSSYFASAIDPANTKSIEAARNLAASEFNEAKRAFESRLNTFWTTNYDPGMPDDPIITGSMARPPGNHGRPPAHIKQMASGSLESGLQLAARQRDRGEGPPWYPNLPEQYDIGDGPDKSWGAMISHLESMRQYAISRGLRVTSLSEKIREVRSIKEKMDGIIKLIETGEDEEGDA